MSDFASKNGEFIFDDWLFLPERLMIHLPTSIALVSDLHLVYDFARNSLGCPTKGIFPNRETMLETELQPLWGALKRHSITKLACGGDVFEGGGDIELENLLLNLFHQNGIEIIAIATGNHDRKGKGKESRLPWHEHGFAVGNWWVIHGDRFLPVGKQLVLGHRHPVISLEAGHRDPCFLLSENQIILPAFSKKVPGVSILKEFRGSTWRCVAIKSNVCMDLGTMDQVYHLVHPVQKQKRDRKTGPA